VTAIRRSSKADEALTLRHNPAHSAALIDKIIYLVCLTLCIELILFKFLPDIANAVIQGDTSNLAEFTVFEHTYLRPGTVHHARVLGNQLLYRLARWIGSIVVSGDVRLHPLRIAAGLLTPFYAFIGILPVLWRGALYDWRAFGVFYALAVTMSLYVFYPGDMPALAFLSIGLSYVLREQLLPAFAFLLVVGLFRETSFHMVWFIAAWALCTHSTPILRRASWVLAFAAAFAVEYWAIRIFFPGPISSSGGLILAPGHLFLAKGFWSLTTLCSLLLATVFPVVCWLKLRLVPKGAWQTRFFFLNCAVFPVWIVFYRMLSGNISEFRMLLPVILPCIYGLSYAYGPIDGERSLTSADGLCN
jgi:hypothetical protein